MYGTPLVDLEEQRKHMGTFRERCRLSMTVTEMKDAQNQRHLLRELVKYPRVTVLLDGEASSDLQSIYIKLLNQHGAAFKIVNSFTESNPDSLGLLLTERHAVDEPVVNVTEKYSQAVETPKEESKAKRSFWQKLFHS